MKRCLEVHVRGMWIVGESGGFLSFGGLWEIGGRVWVFWFEGWGRFCGVVVVMKRYESQASEKAEVGLEEWGLI